ncbi:MAG: tetratricopeptide repeat protein [Planctomycetota bacterium]
MRRIESLLALAALVACGSPDPPVPPAVEDPAVPGETEAAPEEPELDARELDDRGDAHLKAGRFAEAVADFDAAIALEPRLEPHHWRRGIAHYYAGMFEAGAAQFELHRSVNGSDVENAAWHFLCVARWKGPEAARAAVLPVGYDARAPMMDVYEMFAGRKGPDDVLAAAEAAGDSRQAESALFYGHLYVGLYHEALGDEELAARHIGIAATEHTSSHYMGDVARVHATLYEGED